MDAVDDIGKQKKKIALPFIFIRQTFNKPRLLLPPYFDHTSALVLPLHLLLRTEELKKPSSICCLSRL